MPRFNSELKFLIVLFAFSGSAWAQHNDKLDYLEPQAKLKGHTDKLRMVAFSPVGDRIATASNDGTARLWDIKGNQLAKLAVDAPEVRSVKFSPDGSRIVTLTWGTSERLWDQHGNLIRTKGASKVNLLR